MTHYSIVPRLCELGVKVSFILGLSLFAAHAEANDATQRLKVTRHLVIIDRLVDGDWTFAASGTFVKTDDGSYAVVTAQHVVDAEVPLRICGDVRRKSCVVSDKFVNPTEGSDVAYILDVDELPVVPARLSLSDLRTGDDVTFVSLPKGFLVVSNGTIVGPSGEKSYRMLGYCDSGSSGGGLFDSRGRLVGVISAFYVNQIYNDLGIEMYSPVNVMCNVYEL